VNPHDHADAKADNGSAQYLERLQEVKAIVDQLYERAVEGLRDATGAAPKYNDYSAGAADFGFRMM